MAKQQLRKIEIRNAGPDDAAALARVYADASVQAQTLQLPYPSVELWRKRLTEHDENHYALLASVDGEIVGNLGLSGWRAPAARMSAKSAWACASSGRARASAGRC